MKKIKKVLMITIPLLLLNLKTYAIDEILEKGNGYAKYAAIAIAAAILFLIIYACYKLDRKSEINEKQKREAEDKKYEVVEIPQDDNISVFSNESFDYEQEKAIQEDNEEDNLYNSVNEYINNEEESLYNSVNNYNEEKDDLYNIMSESTKADEDNLIEEQNEINISNNEDENIEEFEETVDSIEESFSEPEIIPEIEEVVDTFTFDTAPLIDNNIEENKNSKVDDSVNTEENKSVKKYTGKKLNRALNNFEDIDIDVEDEDFDEEDDEDIGVPTFDDLLKKSEEEEPSEIEPFDFMAQMEENLKKDQEKRLEKKQATKKQTIKKETTKKQTTKKKKEE